MSLNFICKCENCGKIYGITTKTFNEWYNLPPIHKCEEIKL